MSYGGRTAEDLDDYAKGVAELIHTGNYIRATLEI